MGGSKKKKDNAKNKGFTLLEILLVLSILAILSIISVSSYYGLRERQSLKKDADSIVSIIESTKNMSLNRKNDSSYGVYFSTSTVTVFVGDSYVNGNKISNYNLESNVKISAVSISSNSREIEFAKITGNPNATGTITLSTPSYSKVLTIYGTGMIDLK
jgi:prepilin-type N-terminal cleavage/methylation domain-containing protein